MQSCKNILRFLSRDGKTVIYRIVVFTVKAYKELIKERGSNYVLELFIESCKHKNCRFLGLKYEGEYVYALLGFDRQDRYGPENRYY